MLTTEFKKAALEKLEQMSADDFIKIFEEIGSERAEKEINNYSFIEKDLRNYGVHEFNLYTSGENYDKGIVCNDYCGKETLYILAA